MYINYSEIIKFTSVPSFRLLVPEGEASADYKNLSLTLDSICLLFSNYYDIKTRKLNIILLISGDTPICIREKQLILLNTNSTSWCQAAYQFSHELCHYIIPNDVTENLRWLEESICETASYFFLKQLTALWKYNNINLETDDGNLYANTFIAYIENEMCKATPFDLRNPHELTGLKNDCYQREKNKYIANKLLPIFSQYPKTWCAIPLLSSIPSIPSITDALFYWESLLPGSLANGICEIRKLFSTE